MTRLSEDHLGRYSGTGRWHDETGASHAYDVSLTLSRSDAGLALGFTHVFHEEPGTDDVHLALTLREVAPAILAFEMGPIRGRGYQSGDLLHYDIPLPGNLVEATYRFGADGRCSVCGSSEKNSAGHHIMWVEDLARD